MTEARTPLKQVRRKDLKVTQGSISETRSGFLTISSKKVRAVERSGKAQSAKLRFRYRGPTKETAALSSGPTVYQIGLKLRAKNQCNLLYVMWELGREKGQTRDHRERIKVSVKRNPGKEYHHSIPLVREGCGSDGYEPIHPTQEGALPSANDGNTHTLQADLLPAGSKGFDLVVYADDQAVWRGTIAYSLLRDIDGPAGFRTDNGSFTFKFFTGRRHVRDHRD
jgi:hypothetical protein